MVKTGLMVERFWKLREFVCGLVLVGVLVPAALAVDDLSGELNRLIKGSDVPSLSAAVIVGGELRAAGAFGIRRKGDDERVTVDDKYHLGSCTKSMTASLAAILVREGGIKWDTTVEEVFETVKIHARYKGVTLKQLLSNSGGCPGDVERELWGKLWVGRGTLPEQRMQLVEGILLNAPDYEPGSKQVYSNAGFSIAGAMMETLVGKPWEDLMREKIFDPLGMKSAGFRAPATPDKVDQPYGHNPNPVPPVPAGDNPAAIAPAGAVHCSVEDFAKYASAHLGGDRGKLLTDDELAILHRPVLDGGNYGLGWTAAERGWAGGTAYTHTGSNTMFYSVIWIAPNREFAAVAVCNQGGDEAFKKCDAAIAMMIAKYLQ